MELKEKFYYENQEIANVEDVPYGKRVTVKTGVKDKEGNEELEAFTVPEWEYKASTGLTPLDASTARNERAIVVVEKLYDVLKEMDVREKEISFILQKLLAKISCTERQATLNCYGKLYETDVRLSDWESKLKQ